MERKKLAAIYMASMLSCNAVNAQHYSMVVTCKDGSQVIYEDKDLDTVYFKKTEDMAPMLVNENTNGTKLASLMSFDIDLEHNEDTTEPTMYTKVVPCVPGVTVTIYKFNRYPTDEVITFCDCNGSTLETHQNGNGNGEWEYMSAVAPVNTASAVIKYYEKQGQSERTTLNISLKKDEVLNVVTNMATNTKTKTIGILGDSTGQGLQSQMNNGLINNECVLYKGSVGSENVLATAARQGSIPLIVEPFTIPAQSKPRWTNYTGSIVFDGDDPEITISSKLLYYTYDLNGNRVKQIHPKIYFTATYPFYASINGIDGYIYTIGRYFKNPNGIIVVDNDELHTYFHRITPGEKVVLRDTCETVSKDAQLWKESNTINMMGTNGGFTDYEEHHQIDVYPSKKQAAYNLFEIQKIMSEYCNNKYLVVGFFCQCNHTYDKEFFEEYERLCEKEFGERFFNARKALINEAWMDLGITLTNEDKENISKGMAPWSLFGDGKGKPANDPHLTNRANMWLANKLNDYMHKIGWITSEPKKHIIK